MVLALALASALAAAPVEIKVLDDLGRSVRESVKICFSRGLETSCHDGPPFLVPPALSLFDSVTAEGPRHGPFHARRSELPRDRTAYVLKLARKAHLAVPTSGKGTLTVSLYKLDDPGARKPAFRCERVSPSGLWVPSGKFLLSVSDGIHAPELLTLAARPGGKHSHPYRPRQGWSLALRCVSRGSRLPVSKAEALVFTVADGAERQIRSTTSDPDGLAYFVGMTDPFAHGGVSAPGHLTTKVPGLFSSSGTFTFREAVLASGGKVEGTVTLDGKPAEGARWSLLKPRSEDPRKREPESVAEGRTAQKGTLRTPAVPEGPYLLRIFPPDAPNGTDEDVTVTEGETTEAEVSLTSIPVDGTVYRGDVALSGAVVEILNRARMRSIARDVLDAGVVTKTDETGSYRATLWDPGSYYFMVRSAVGGSVGLSRLIEIGNDPATVDLRLNPFDVTGRVVDDKDEPVAEASITLISGVPHGRHHRLGLSGTDGAFVFPLGGQGAVTLEASKLGYRHSGPVELQVMADVAPNPVLLRMAKLPAIRGVVTFPAGGPAPGIAVFGYLAAPGQSPRRLGNILTDASGRFEVPSAEASTRLFATGVGCPLLVTDVPPDTPEIRLRCAPGFSAIELILRDQAGKPLPDEGVLLQWNGQVIPREVLTAHQALLRLPLYTDSSGTLPLIGLPAGQYDVFATVSASEATIAARQAYGHLVSVQLLSDRVETVEVVIRARLRPSMAHLNSPHHGR